MKITNLLAALAIGSLAGVIISAATSITTPKNGKSSDGRISGSSNGSSSTSDPIEDLLKSKISEIKIDELKIGKIKK